MASVSYDQSAVGIRSYRLGKLKKTEEFSFVFDFRRRLSSEHLVLHFRPNNLGYARLGLVTSKKVAKTAVARNYMRRVLRELFRLNQPTLPACDMVINVRKKFVRADFIMLQQQFNYLRHKLALQYGVDTKV